MAFGFDVGTTITSVLRVTTLRILPTVLCASLASLGLAGCQTLPGDSNALQSTFASNDPCSNSSRNTGIAVGGALGAVAGALLGGKNARDKVIVGAIGAAAGALVGGVIGHNIDERRCALFKVAQANNLDLVVSDIKVADTQVDPLATPKPQGGGSADAAKTTAGLSVSIIDKGEQFAPGSAILTPQAAKAMADLADTYRDVAAASASAKDRDAVNARNNAMRILLVGHTDDTGSSQLNADLSEARARAVAKIFVSRGFRADQIFYQGAGETLPIADNHSAAGRARNRRVEVVDLGEDEAMAGYLANRKPVLAYYRTPGPAASGQRKETTGGAQPTSSRKASVGQANRNDRPSVASPDPSATDATPSAHASTAAQDIDFGGTPVHGNYVQVSIGKLSTQKSTFSLLSTAHAAEPSIVGSCADDRPRISKGVKSLKNDREAKFSTNDYLPGVYDSSWAGLVNGHLVALTHVAVLRDGGSPARRPELLVYTNYSGDKKAEPTLRSKPEVNAYQGSDALLYRVFVGDSLQCMDIVIPNKDPRHAPDSNLVYTLNKQSYQTAFAPSLAK
ncbi:Outer membrane protein ArfA [Achromobacter xylosoxidans]|uniref:OmpA family protein n=1 Tax=Alcaligenes xylosoxydans xylosoxydans TaxID=85698 RepID=UPI0006BEE681|nr:OmpA family protein [Achromobacter xylosoxidans]CUI37727.1 Outer membrane protein ArfA [Achromobacter xylosoxidans]